MEKKLVNETERDVWGFIIIIIIIIIIITAPTERSGRVVTTSTSYSRGPGDRLTWLGVFVVFLNSSSIVP
jgi:hypothetical protein